VKQSTLSPVRFALIVESGIGLLKESQSGIAHRFVAVLLEFFDLGNPQIVHFRIRAFRKAWRQRFFTPEDFLLSFFELIPQMVIGSIKYPFRLLDERIYSTNIGGESVVATATSGEFQMLQSLVPESSLSFDSPP
jgi:hypothetical protein